MTQLTNNALDRLLTARSVCRLLDLSDRGLRRWVACGKFPPPDLKIGRNLRWRASTVDQFVRGKQEGDHP